MSLEMPDSLIEPVVRMALAEDLGRAGDVTVAACIDPQAHLSAAFVSRQHGVVAGLACVRLAITALDPTAKITLEAKDGDVVAPRSVLVRVEANAGALLTAERTALNLLGRLCGIATLTSAYVFAIKHTRARITDTRKTTPGLRALEKYAVRCGGVAEALMRARAHVGHMMKVEIEVDTLDQFDEALECLPDVIMLDNFSLEDLAEAVKRNAGQVVLEASGGVSLQTVRAIAETGVDVISVGALTHSAPVLDIGLDAT